ncbi:hypothetical protein HK104_003090, partial [Borealophlyctis nickersoniae]
MIATAPYPSSTRDLHRSMDSRSTSAKSRPLSSKSRPHTASSTKASQPALPKPPPTRAYPFPYSLFVGLSPARETTIDLSRVEPLPGFVEGEQKPDVERKGSSKRRGAERVVAWGPRPSSSKSLLDSHPSSASFVDGTRIGNASRPSSSKSTVRSVWTEEAGSRPVSARSEFEAWQEGGGIMSGISEMDGGSDFFSESDGGDGDSASEFGSGDITGNFPYRLPNLYASHARRVALEEAAKRNPHAVPTRIVVANFSKPVLRKTERPMTAPAAFWRVRSTESERGESVEEAGVVVKPATSGIRSAPPRLGQVTREKELSVPMAPSAEGLDGFESSSQDHQSNQAQPHEIRTPRVSDGSDVKGDAALSSSTTSPNRQRKASMGMTAWVQRQKSQGADVELARNRTPAARKWGQAPPPEPKVVEKRRPS